MVVELVAIDLSLCHLQCLCYNVLFEHCEHQESESLGFFLFLFLLASGLSF